MNEDKIESYRKIKTQVIIFLQGFTKSNLSFMSRINVMFKHLEDLFFGKEINIIEEVLF